MITPINKSFLFRAALGFSIVLGVLGFAPQTAQAASDCKTKSGKSVSMSNGATTANLTDRVLCKYSAGHSIKKRYVKGKVVEEETTHRNGKRKKHGFYWYTKNGNSRKDKTWREWYENGKLRSQDTYARGDKHGPYIRFTKDGKKREEGVYEQGKKLGSITYNTDGTLSRLSCSENPAAKRHKPFAKMCGFTSKKPITAYYEQGKRSRVYWYDKGVLVAWEKYNASGALVESDKKAVGNKVGVKVSKHPNGKKKQETRYNAKGMLHGTQREYDKTGPMTREAQFEDGFMVTEKIFFFNGQLRRHTQKQKRGKETHVVAKSFHDNGKLRRQGQYIERRRVHRFGFGHYWNYQDLEAYGQHKEYRKNGTLLATERYKEGRQEGISIQYHDNGKTKHLEQEYAAGNLVREKKYNRSGRLISHEEFFRDGSSKRHKVR